MSRRDQRAKAVAAYVRLIRVPRAELPEADARQLEQVEADLRTLNGLEVVEILRANSLRLP